MSDLHQAELALARRALDSGVGMDLVRRQKSAASALSLACGASGLEDKEIYLSLGIDPGHFSRMKKGEAGFPPDKLNELCELVGNTIYVEWMAYQVGCTLVMVKSEAERRAEAAEAKATALEAQNKLMRELLAGRVA